VEVRQALEMWKEHEKAENSEKPENALSSQDFVGLIVVKLVSYADWAARHKKYEMVKLLWQEAATQDEPNDRYWQPRYRLLKVVNAHLQGSHVSQAEFGDLQLSVLGESSLLDVLRELRQEH